MIGYGSPANPYREHPAEPIKDVHWYGAQAVKWKVQDFIYSLAPLDAASTTTATLSVWIKFLDDEFVSSSPFFVFVGQGYQLQFQYGGGMREYPPPGGVPFPPGYGHSIEYFVSPASGQFAYLQDDPYANPLVEKNKWYHLYAEWNTGSGSFALTVNGHVVSTLIVAGDDTLYYTPGFYTGFPISVAWGAAFDSSFSGPGLTALQNFYSKGSTEPDYTGAVRYSLAELWLDVAPPPAILPPLWGVDRFVSSAGTPKSLGDHGEIPTGSPPMLYFSRRGTAATFCTNRGSGGTFQFAIGHSPPSGSYTWAPADPTIDGPLVEPDAPHFTPG